MAGRGRWNAAGLFTTTILVLIAACHTVVAQSITDPRCSSPFGNFPDPGNCERYISCWGGRGFSQSCGSNLIFHPETKSCQSGSTCPGVKALVAPDSGQKLRLSNGRGPWAGQLRVKFNGEWAYVDARGWANDLGELVCKQLGFEGYEGGQGTVPTSRGSTPILQLTCPSSATSVIQCNLNRCTTCFQSTKVANIRCKPASSSRCPSTQLPFSQQRAWNRWKDNCYLVLDDYRAPRDLARNMCRERGGELLNIKDQSEHEYVSDLIVAASGSTNLEYYTDGAGVRVGGLRLWVWETSRGNLLHNKWWPGWNSTRTSLTAPSPKNSPSCLVLKKAFPTSSSSSSTYDSGFYFFSDSVCSLNKPFVCKATLKDAGCYEGDGSTYSGVADVTTSGRSCLSWDDPRINSLHDRDPRARNFDLGLLGNHNFCRNPDRARSPWCFVAPGVAEACALPKCGQGDSVAGASSSASVSSSSSSSSSSSPSLGTGTRSSTLLRPFNRPNTLPITTTPRTTVTTPKIRCGSNEHTCEDNSKCLDLKQVCDGDRQCPRGDDERSCKRFLQEFEGHNGQTLILSEVLENLSREEEGVCAKKCIDNNRCKGFLYDKQRKRCSLTSTDVVSSGLMSSSHEMFYELRSRRGTCGVKFRCNNERCVDRKKLCDNVDDCGDGTDEGQCRTAMKYETKLVGGSGNHEGNVQIRVGNEWGFICDDKFDFNAADLLCRGLGFQGALTFTRNNKFGANTNSWRRSTPKFWFDEVTCSGNEKSFFDCPANNLGVHDCGPTEIAGVVCRTGDTLCSANEFECGRARLHTCISRDQVCNGDRDCFDGSDEAPELCDDVGVTRLETRKSSLDGTAAGTVFVKHKGRWGTVCDDSFDEKHAKVICRSLGYDEGWAVPYPRAFFGQGTGDILIDEPLCKGKENWIGECPAAVWGVSDCDHAEDVGVLCSDPMEIRLAGGPTSNSGRVEVKLSGVWGTVCDDDFDDYDAKVVCGMLGYKGDAIAHKNARHGRGSGPIWLESLDCNGNEADFKQCKKSPPSASDCTHSEDASVTCYSIRRGSVDKGLSTVLPDGCGRRTDSSSTSFLIDNFAKIVGGTSQQPLEHPWLVSLQLREEGRLKHNCGGVVIGEDYVLTAAHCFKVHGRQSYVIRVGDYRMNSRDDGQEDFQIEKLWVHDEFDTTVEFNNDIAILKVARKNGRGIRFGKSIQPACLPPEGASYSNLRDCSITGWGTTSERAPPVPQNIPRSGPVNVYQMSTCTGPSKYGLFEVTSGMFCAGHLDGRIDTCTGDSGGPLMCRDGDSYILYGITSWGKGCGRRGQPGMYTKITKFLRWIHDTIV